MFHAFGNCFSTCYAGDLSCNVTTCQDDEDNFRKVSQSLPAFDTSCYHWCGIIILFTSLRSMIVPIHSSHTVEFSKIGTRTLVYD